MLARPSKTGASAAELWRLKPVLLRRAITASTAAGREPMLLSLQAPQRCALTGCTWSHTCCVQCSLRCDIAAKRHQPDESCT